MREPSELINSSRRTLIKGAVAWPFASSVLAASTLSALPRFALVVGNARYPTAPLINPANDAAAITKELQGAGFAVTTCLDFGQQKFKEAVRLWSEQLARSRGVGFFYFAGHAVQLNWRNFLLPVDVKLARADDLVQSAVDITGVLEALGKAGNPMNIVMLDACRDNPFASDQKSGRGLSQMDAPASTLLAYATAPGNVAADGTGSNGLYTEHLLREMKTPNAKIEDVLKRVRLNVRRASGGQQIPWESTSLEDDFYFFPPPDLRKLSQEELDRQFKEESNVWKSAQAKEDVAAVERYIRQYPNGKYSELAQFRLDQLLARQGEKKVVAVVSPDNPFSKGSMTANVRYRLGDAHGYVYKDLLTGVESGKQDVVVTEIDGDRVIFNQGATIADLLGNPLRFEDKTYVGMQVYGLEYAVGKKWNTRFSIKFANGNEDEADWEVKVVTREPIEVPAGKFNAFKLEIRGWFRGNGIQVEQRIWTEPDAMPRPLRIERLSRRMGRTVLADQRELIYFRPGAA